MCNARIVLCEACGSEGRLYHYTGGVYWDGSPRGYDEPCPWCEGTGGELIETQPIELDDLDPMAGGNLPDLTGRD